MKEYSGNPYLCLSSGKNRGKKVIIVIKKGGEYYKIVKFEFNNKGDLYIFTPYTNINSGKLSYVEFPYGKDAPQSVTPQKQTIYEFKDQRPKISYHESGAIHFSGGGVDSRGYRFYSTSFKDMYMNDTYTSGPRISLQITNIENGFQKLDISKKCKYDIIMYDYETLFKAPFAKKGGKFNAILLYVYIYPYKYRVYEYMRFKHDNQGKIYYLPDTMVNSKVVLGFIAQKFNFSYSGEVSSYDEPSFILGFSSGENMKIGKQFILSYPKELLGKH